MEQGWPWRWAMDWMASAVKSLLEVRGLPLPSNEPLRAEREWSLARRLVRDRSGLHPPIDPQRVIHFGQLMLADLSPDPRHLFLFDRLATRFGYSELADIVAKAGVFATTPDQERQ